MEKHRKEIEEVKQDYERQLGEWDAKLKQVSSVQWNLNEQLQEKHEIEKDELNTQKQQIRENFDKLEGIEQLGI